MTVLNYFLTKKDQRYALQHPDSAVKLATDMRSLIQKYKPLNSETIIFCIGSDRSTGDALGPLIGSKLQANYNYPHVYGTLEQPVHATNLSVILKDLYSNYKSPFLIAIDACLGRYDSIGSVNMGCGPLKPGAALKKELPAVGDIHITGIVNVSGFMEHMVLQSTRLHLVMTMAELISSAIALSVPANKRCINQH